MRDLTLQKMILEFQRLDEYEKQLKNVDSSADTMEKIKKIKRDKDELYVRIENEYGLSWRVKTWANSYLMFFDSYDDFWSLCREVFFESILSFKPMSARLRENLRKYEKGIISKSDIHPKGSGEFNSYFACCLSNELVNYYNSLQTQSRNPKVQCPICLETVSPLKKHLKQDHKEDIRRYWNKRWGKDMEDFDKCPLCKAEVNDMFRHVVSRHADFVYEMLSLDIAQYATSKAYSLDFEYGEDDESFPLMDMLYNNDSSDVCVGDSVVENVNYSAILDVIAKNIKDNDELLMFKMLLAGYTKREICEYTNWSHDKYAEIKKRMRNRLLKKSSIRKCFSAI